MRDRERERERDREKEREKDREREKERERERADSHRKEEAVQEDRGYGRGHGRDDGGRAEGRMDNRMDRTERNGRGRGRANETSDKGRNRHHIYSSYVCGLQGCHFLISPFFVFYQVQTETPGAPSSKAAMTTGSHGAVVHVNAARRGAQTAALPKEAPRGARTETATRVTGEESQPVIPPTTGEEATESGIAGTTEREVWEEIYLECGKNVSL